MKPTDGDSDTLPATDPALTPTVAALSGHDSTLSSVPRQAGTRDRASLSNYRLGALIGSGGMGEVVLARDQQIGRDVAIKRMRTSAPTPDAIARFLREARIQARLEHPAIVPVHELGNDLDGQPYFTMKRLAGVTLAEQLATTPPPPRARLLRAFADVCRAVEFAHSHAVVHRDLKPGNIMLGDFGEVYVLDWGLARVTGEAEDTSIANDIASLDGMTQVGAILGTPGYMAPEQVRGAGDVGAPADVYALGSILFEILAGEALHPRGAAALTSTLAAIDGSPHTRHPDRAIPPELDTLCSAALLADPARRPTAKELADRVGSYLDGDRDLERRKQLSAEWLAKARTALDDDEVGRRAEALQHASRALAIDPESHPAAELFTRLILVPAKEHPPELQRALAAADEAIQRRQARTTTVAFTAFAAFVLLVSWNGVRSPAILASVATLAAVLAAVAFRFSRRCARPGDMVAVAIGNALLAMLLSRAFGSLIVAPAVTCVMAVSLSSYPQLIDRSRLVIAILLTSWITPVVLESAGVIAATWHVEHGEVVSTSTMVAIGGTSTTALLVAVNLLTIAVTALYANALARSRRNAQHQAEAQAWHLRQLIPTSAP